MKQHKELKEINSFPAEQWTLDRESLSDTYWDDEEDKAISLIDNNPIDEEEEILIAGLPAIDFIKEYLTEHEFIVVYRHLWEGASYAVIGRETGFVRQTIYVHYTKALKKLKGVVEDVRSEGKG